MSHRFPLLFSFLALLIAVPVLADVPVTGSGSGGDIPDNDTNGFANTITITEARTIINARFEIEDLSHAWVGDLVATVTHTDSQNNQTTAQLFNRTGKAQSSGDGDSSNLSGTYSFRDDSVNDWWSESGNGGDNYEMATGDYRASNNLGGFVNLDNLFGGQSSAGDWTLSITDLSGQHVGSFAGWNVELLTAVPEPTAAVAIFGAATLLLRRRRKA